MHACLTGQIGQSNTEPTGLVYLGRARQTRQERGPFASGPRRTSADAPHRPHRKYQRAGDNAVSLSAAPTRPVGFTTVGAVPKSDDDGRARRRASRPTSRRRSWRPRVLGRAALPRVWGRPRRSPPRGGLLRAEARAIAASSGPSLTSRRAEPAALPPPSAGGPTTGSAPVG